MKVAIAGAAELGKLAAYHAVSDVGCEVVGFYDDFFTASSFFNFPILGKCSGILDDFQNGLFDKLFIGIGYHQMVARITLFEKFKGKIPFANIIHSSCYVDQSCELGEGIFLLPGVVLDFATVLSDNVLLNTGVVVAHHTKIGEHTFIAPGAKLAGLIRVGKGCFIGIGSSISDSVCIADGSIIGAGAVVLSNTEPNSVSMGVPARLVKYRAPLTGPID
ncbi:acetyltransferase [Bradyrhizobium sp.]|uniref:acetyltransferase n=1 Tax=Bradyrhizobium sp. TaxID=376 RepID=UPI003C75F2B3